MTWTNSFSWLSFLDHMVEKEAQHNIINSNTSNYGWGAWEVSADQSSSLPSSSSVEPDEVFLLRIFCRKLRKCFLKLEACCSHCRSEYDQYQILHLTATISQPTNGKPTSHFRCSECNYMVAVSFGLFKFNVVDEMDLPEMFEFYSKPNLQIALIHALEKLKQVFPHNLLPNFIKYRPELAWALVFHFKSLERGLERCQATHYFESQTLKKHHVTPSGSWCSSWANCAHTSSTT